MPRKGQGNKVMGSNRVPAEERGLLNETVGGQTYGAQTAQRAQQQAVPMGQGPSAAASGGMSRAAGAVPTGIPPGLTSPTNEPDTPLTAGIDSGPGPGSGALAAAQVGPRDVATLSRSLPALEALASLPNATVAFKNMVRRIRSAVPVDTAPSSPQQAAGPAAGPLGGAPAGPPAGPPGAGPAGPPNIPMGP